MMRYFLPQTLFAVLLVGTIGCSYDHHSRIDYSHVDLVHGSGRITLDGQPLPYAQVFFEDIEKATTAFGLTDENGKYVLMFNSVKEGVEAGNKRVQIWTARGGVEFRDKIPKENLGRGKERVPDRYNRKTELVRTVLSSKEQRTQKFDFELESKGRISNDLVPAE
ncbi:MAG: carboxypeptidase-like regulatory domain-containing protein [Planctomycetaceae bacterium]|jgi:hypothetical protein|nr:carboxypeptidase-like regulatory domain-containing protein [Planctomycetaceae bacterium]